MSEKSKNGTFINKTFDRYCFGKGLLTCLKQGNHLNPSKIGAGDDFRPNVGHHLGDKNAEKSFLQMFSRIRPDPRISTSPLEKARFALFGAIYLNKFR